LHHFIGTSATPAEYLLKQLHWFFSLSMWGNSRTG
jgi:hypothetical protein